MNLTKNRMTPCQERQCQCTYRSLNYNNPFYFAHDFYFCVLLLCLLLCDIFRIWVGAVSYFWYVILHMQAMDHVYEQRRILQKMSH